MYFTLCTSHPVAGDEILADTEPHSYIGGYCSVAASGATVCHYPRDHQLHTCSLATAALLVYESFIILDREVTSIWYSKRTGASLLFAANKGISLIATVMLLCTFASFYSEKVSIGYLHLRGTIF